MADVFAVLDDERDVEDEGHGQDLDLLTVGMVPDLWTEKANDTVAVSRDNNSILIAGQEQFDNF